MKLEDLQKRLIKISSTGIKEKILPISAIRRGDNQVTNGSEVPEQQFDSFFDFEDDLNQIESARKQIERLEEAKIIEKNFIANENTSSASKQKSPSEIIIFDEEDSDLIINDEDGEIIEKEVFEVETKIELIKPSVKDIENNKKNEMKLCKHIKSDGERCRRQAPKDNDYCKAHR